VRSSADRDMMDHRSDTIVVVVVVVVELFGEYDIQGIERLILLDVKDQQVLVQRLH
jgi:hypothetical protein